LSVLIAAIKLPLAEALDQLVKAPTCMGLDLVIVLLSPLAPYKFGPHVQRVPSVFMAALTALVAAFGPAEEDTDAQVVKVPI
jgi:hypothetical protein